jgi:hypothetical protein
LRAPEELARLIANRLGELEGTRQPAHFAQPVCEVPFRFRLKPPTGLLTTHPRESPSLLPGKFVPVCVGAASDFRRQAAIVAGRSEWGTRPVAVVFVEPSPLWPVVETLLLNNEATVLADGFDCVGGDPAVALGTLVRARFRSDVFVEARFVDVSGCHRFHHSQELACSARPSPIEGVINAIEYEPQIYWIWNNARYFMNGSLWTLDMVNLELNGKI